jgi:iron complex transport system ATP-binding protein
MKSLLSIQNVSFSYDERPVLQDLSFDLKEGDLVGILGPNGSGKTTLLRLMAGSLKPARGQVELEGNPLTDLRGKERAKKIAMVPQEFDIAFPFRSSEVVLMGRWPYLKPMAWERPEDLAIAQRAMELTNSLQFSDRLVTELSGGERERLLIARALAQEPKILLLDEPTTHLDLQHQLRIHELFARLNRERNLSMAVVLHDLNFAALACKRILLLKEGRMVKEGSPEEVLQVSTLEEVFEVPVSMERLPHSKIPFFFPKIGA